MSGETEQMARWLQVLRLQKYIPVFEQHGITIKRLSSTSDAELARMGLPVGPRKKLLAYLGVMRSALSQSSQGTQPDSQCIPDSVRSAADAGPDHPVHKQSASARVSPVSCVDTTPARIPLTSRHQNIPPGCMTPSSTDAAHSIHCATAQLARCPNKPGGATYVAERSRPDQLSPSSSSPTSGMHMLDSSVKATSAYQNHSLTHASGAAPHTSSASDYRTSQGRCTVNASTPHQLRQNRANNQLTSNVFNSSHRHGACAHDPGSCVRGEARPAAIGVSANMGTATKPGLKSHCNSHGIPLQSMTDAAKRLSVVPQTPTSLQTSNNRTGVQSQGSVPATHEAAARHHTATVDQPGAKLASRPNMASSDVPPATSPSSCQDRGVAPGEHKNGLGDQKAQDMSARLPSTSTAVVQHTVQLPVWRRQEQDMFPVLYPRSSETTGEHSNIQTTPELPACRIKRRRLDASDGLWSSASSASQVPITRWAAKQMPPGQQLADKTVLQQVSPEHSKSTTQTFAVSKLGHGQQQQQPHRNVHGGSQLAAAEESLPPQHSTSQSSPQELAASPSAGATTTRNGPHPAQCRTQVGVQTSQETGDLEDDVHICTEPHHTQHRLQGPMQPQHGLQVPLQPQHAQRGLQVPLQPQHAQHRLQVPLQPQHAVHQDMLNPVNTKARQAKSAHTSRHAVSAAQPPSNLEYSDQTSSHHDDVNDTQTTDQAHPCSTPLEEKLQVAPLRACTPESLASHGQDMGTSSQSADHTMRPNSSPDTDDLGYTGQSQAVPVRVCLPLASVPGLGGSSCLMGGMGGVTGECQRNNLPYSQSIQGPASPAAGCSPPAATHALSLAPAGDLSAAEHVTGPAASAHHPLSIPEITRCTPQDQASSSQEAPRMDACPTATTCRAFISSEHAAPTPPASPAVLQSAPSAPTTTCAAKDHCRAGVHPAISLIAPAPAPAPAAASSSPTLYSGSAWQIQAADRNGMDPGMFNTTTATPAMSSKISNESPQSMQPQGFHAADAAACMQEYGLTGVACRQACIPTGECPDPGGERQRLAALKKELQAAEKLVARLKLLIWECKLDMSDPDEVEEQDDTYAGEL